MSYPVTGDVFLLICALWTHSRGCKMMNPELPGILHEEALCRWQGVQPNKHLLGFDLKAIMGE